MEGVVDVWVVFVLLFRQTPEKVSLRFVGT